jgi:hypothetical protein
MKMGLAASSAKKSGKRRKISKLSARNRSELSFASARDSVGRRSRLNSDPPVLGMLDASGMNSRTSFERDNDDDCKSEDEVHRIVDSDDSDNPDEEEKRADREDRELSEVTDSQSSYDEEDDYSENEDGARIIPNLHGRKKCSTHNLVIHSFDKRTRQLLCTQCVQESGLSMDDIQVFPVAMRAIKDRIQDAKDLNKQRKM